MANGNSLGNPDPSDFIETHGKQAVKTKSFYDGSNRLSYYIVATKDAQTGDKCLVTKYSYVGVTSRVDTSTEYFADWNSSWDLSEDTPS